MTFDELMDIAPYSLGKEEKHAVLDEYLLNLTRYHYEHSEDYKKMLDGTGVDISKIQHLQARKPQRFIWTERLLLIRRKRLPRLFLHFLATSEFL